MDVTAAHCVCVEAITKPLFYTALEHNGGADGEPVTFLFYLPTLPRGFSYISWRDGEVDDPSIGPDIGGYLVYREESRTRVQLDPETVTLLKCHITCSSLLKF